MSKWEFLLHFPDGKAPEFPSEQEKLQSYNASLTLNDKNK